MKNSKLARTFGILCIIFTLLVFIKGIIIMTGGISVLLLDPAPDSSTRELQLLFNSGLERIFEFSGSLPMYFALAAFYFYGAVGESRWSKLLFAGLILTFLMETGAMVVFFIAGDVFNFFEVMLIKNEPGRFVYERYVGLARSFFRLIPVIAICFSVAALLAKRVSTSISLAPALAAFVYIFIEYATLRYSTGLPDYFALLIYIGLTGVFLSGAIGKTVWSKLLFGSLVALFLGMIGIGLIVYLVNFMTGLGGISGVSENVLFQGFAVLGGVKYIFLPLLCFVFGGAVIGYNKENVLLGLFVIFTGLLYVVSSILPADVNLFAKKGSSILFKFTFIFGMHSLIWALVAFAVLGVNKIIKPFIIFTIVLNFLLILMGMFSYLVTDELLSPMFTAFVISSIVHLIFVFYIWNSIDDGQSSIKPWMTVLGGIIPFIGTIWLFVMLTQYSGAYNKYIDRNGSPASYINSMPFTAFIVLTILFGLGFWIPYVGKLIGVGVFIAFILMIRAGLNAVSNLRFQVVETQ